MNRIEKRDGYVYLVEDCDKKGFETYYNLGKDIDSPIWEDEVKEMNFKKRKNKKKDVV